MIRSFLFVPADSERKLQKAASSKADALIVDLEDAVAPKMRPAARQLAQSFIAEHQHAWVRINPMDSPDAILDLEAVMAAGPAGIVLPKPRGATDILALIGVLEKLEGTGEPATAPTRILPICTERPEALFALNDYVGLSDRLYGLTWGAEDLAAAIGALCNRDANGDWLPTFVLARSLCLLAAAAAEVAAIDTVYTDFKNATGLQRSLDDARRDGFSGMLAIHPNQVELINAAFEPTDDEIARATRVVALFAENPDSGALSLDGEMVDRPHLVQAERLLAARKNT